MSMTSALADLRSSLAGLAEAVDELAVTSLEDQPTDNKAAVADVLAEFVSEIQGAVARARRAIADVKPAQLPIVLPDVHAAVDEATTRYWRDLCAHRPVAELRRAATERGREWQAWEASIQRATAQCEQPLAAVRRAVRDAWQEISELVSLRLLPAHTDNATDDHSCSTSSRRPS
jgi:hypothetical protein